MTHLIHPGQGLAVQVEEMAEAAEALVVMAEVMAAETAAVTDEVEVHPMIHPTMEILDHRVGARRRAGQISSTVKRFSALKICISLTHAVTDLDGPTLVPSTSSSRSTAAAATRKTATRPKPANATPLSDTSANSVGVKCRCDAPAAERTVVKEGANKGRRFWKCGNGDQCNFFEWMDGPSQTSITTPGPPRSAVGQRSVRT